MYNFTTKSTPWADVTVRKVEIGDKITSIGDSAFSQTSVKSVKIPNSVKTIGNSAFEDCELESITIPKGVTKINESAFAGDNSLKSIKVNRGNKKYSSKDGVLFNKNKSALVFYPSGKKGSRYTVPSSVRRIKSGAFDGYPGQNVFAKVRTLTMPKRIKIIENYALSETKIKTINFPGKRPERIGKHAFGENDTLTIRYKAKNWPASARQNYGAKKINWKNY